MVNYLFYKPILVNISLAVSFNFYVSRRIIIRCLMFFEADVNVVVKANFFIYKKTDKITYELIPDIS